MLKNILLKLKENMTEREAEIIAWIVASEGAIGISKHKKKGAKLGFNLDSYIQIGNTNFEFIEKACKLIGTNYVTYYKPKPFTNHKIIYNIRVHKHEDVLFLLKKIMKFLPIKQEQAKLVEQFCLARIKKPYSYLTEKDIEIYEKLRKLNKRGLH